MSFRTWFNAQHDRDSKVDPHHADAADDVHVPSLEDLYDLFTSIPKKDSGATFSTSNPKYQTFKNRDAASPAAPREGYVSVGKKDTYHARGAIKQLRGYWDPDSQQWFVPIAHKDAALDAIRKAAVRQADLTADEVTRLLQQAGVQPGAANSLPPEKAPSCWECGGPLHEFVTRMGTHTTVLKKGAVEAEDYCGCVERGDQRRRHRPDFRAGTF